MEKLKDLGIFLIPYFLVCSSIYHLTYWNTFNINGLEFISLENIIKTSAYPLFNNLSLPYIASIMLLLLIITSNQKLKNQENNREIPKIILAAIFIIWATYIFSLYYQSQWLTIPVFFALFPALYLLNLNIKYFRSIRSSHTFYIYYILTILPVYFFASAKIESEKIRDNVTFKYIVSSEVNKNNIFKYLGGNESRLIVSSIDNRKIYYIKMEMDTLKFNFYSRTDVTKN